MNKYFYIGKKEALNYQSMVYAVSDFKIDNHKEIHGENSIEYYGDNLPYYVTVLDDETAREATTIELYRAGIYELQEYEFISDDKIMNIYDFPIPEEIVKPSFDYELLEWVETATEEEIVLHNFEIARNFYNGELEFASKATAELLCEIITLEMYEDVKNYMQAIDPYAQSAKFKTLSTVKRPEIFNKYN